MNDIYYEDRMGISTHYYTVLGRKLPWNNDFNDYVEEFDLWDNEKHGDRGFDIIIDNMGGEYIIIGKILFDSGDLRWNEFKDQYKEISFENFAKMSIELGAAMGTHIDPKFHNYVFQQTTPSLMTFAHYS